MKSVAVGAVCAVFSIVTVNGLSNVQSAETKTAPEAIEPCVVMTGADSKNSKPGYHRITSVKEWARVWQIHKGKKVAENYNFYYNPLDLPKVDFDRFMVIAIFRGDGWNSAGLQAVSIAENKGRFVFRFDEKTYQTAGPDGGGRAVTVYGFFVIPKSTKDIVFEQNVQGLKGKPPVWKTRATISSP